MRIACKGLFAQIALRLESRADTKMRSAKRPVLHYLLQHLRDSQEMRMPPRQAIRHGSRVRPRSTWIPVIAAQGQDRPPGLNRGCGVASGHVIADLTPRHRAREFRRFLDLIDEQVPDDLAVHVVLDDVATHRTAEIKRWLRRHPRYTFHLTSTYSPSPWMNLV